MSRACLPRYYCSTIAWVLQTPLWLTLLPPAASPLVSCGRGLGLWECVHAAMNSFSSVSSQYDRDQPRATPCQHIRRSWCWPGQVSEAGNPASGAEACPPASQPAITACPPANTSVPRHTHSRTLPRWRAHIHAHLRPHTPVLSSTEVGERTGGQKQGGQQRGLCWRPMARDGGATRRPATERRPPDTWHRLSQNKRGWPSGQSRCVGASDTTARSLATAPRTVLPSIASSNGGCPPVPWVCASFSA